VRIDARLREFDFGAWDGRRWDAIPRAELDAWCADFADYAPGAGDTLADFLERVRAVRADPPAPLLVTHGGWLSALRWLEGRRAGDEPSDDAGDDPRAADWPPAPACGRALRWRPQRGATRAVAAAAAAASVAATDTGRAAPGAGVFGV
jgi:alpha-ribazole phosphatase